MRVEQEKKREEEEGANDIDGSKDGLAFLNIQFKILKNLPINIMKVGNCCSQVAEEEGEEEADKQGSC